MTLADTSFKTASALLKEARAVKRTTKAYNGLHRGSAGLNAEDVSRNIVLSYLGGGR